MRTLINRAATNESVLIQGFVEHIRNTRNMAFLVLRDRSGRLQATIEKSAHPEWNELLDALTRPMRLCLPMPTEKLKNWTPNIRPFRRQSPNCYILILR